MGMMPIWYSTNKSGVPASKRKFRSSAEKQAFLAAQKTEFGVAGKKTKFVSQVNSMPSMSVPPGRETPHYPSRDSGGGVAARAADKVYTGTLMKGIGTLHKSNAVPVFSDEEAVEIARMRRG
jgi:hypothetical protein